MCQVPDYTNISQTLSEVLRELGINEEIVWQKRRTCMLAETMKNVVSKMHKDGISFYGFGSRAEGTSTRGLESDTDILLCSNVCNVIQDFRDWKPAADNLLMVYNVTTPPEYCLLQRLRSDVALPETEIIDEHHVRDSHGRVLLKTTKLTSYKHADHEQHGPAFAQKAEPGLPPIDTVFAYSCDSVLDSVRQWVSQAKPVLATKEMKRKIAERPCFLVPVGSRVSADVSYEWRISTSLAERDLVYSLNIVQVQVYVLMKMLLKTCINFKVQEESHVSSYMCKTVLLHCIQNSDQNIWRSHMLIQCLLKCLLSLYVCVMNEYCPHFIISANNLMAGRFTLASKHQLNENFKFLFQEFVPRGILSLCFDNIADRLVIKLGNMMSGFLCPPVDEECQLICANQFHSCAANVEVDRERVLLFLKDKELKFQKYLLKRQLVYLQQVNKNGDFFERLTCRLLTSFLCTTLGSLLASSSMETSGIISPEALTYFSLGLDSDLTSSRLKLASTLYMAGELERAEIILRDVNNWYDFDVSETVCACRVFQRELLPSRRKAMFVHRNESNVLKLISSCVRFMPTERYCVPQELQYEMYRSTPDDLPHRGKDDGWMDWAVVDSVPFLHFLQYKVYSRLQRRDGQQRALNNFMSAIQKEPNLGHQETALNLLGQYFEKEYKWNEAMWCYSQSLNICPRNNVAKLHICLLIYRYLSSTS